MRSILLWIYSALSIIGNVMEILQKINYYYCWCFPLKIPLKCIFFPSIFKWQSILTVSRVEFFFIYIHLDIFFILNPQYVSTCIVKLQQTLYNHHKPLHFSYPGARSCTIKIWKVATRQTNYQVNKSYYINVWLPCWKDCQ